MRLLYIPEKQATLCVDRVEQHYYVYKAVAESNSGSNSTFNTLLLLPEAATNPGARQVEYYRRPLSHHQNCTFVC
jgi:hypothetical protein